MSEEHRRHPRHIIRMAAVQGEFLLTAYDHEHRLTQVHDLSISGMGVFLNQALPPDTAVSIRYMARDIEVTVRARVAWWQRSTQTLGESGATENYRLGLEFNRREMENNMLLFMALRKYLDKFD